MTNISAFIEIYSFDKKNKISENASATCAPRKKIQTCERASDTYNARNSSLGVQAASEILEIFFFQIESLLETQMAAVFEAYFEI
jgi:hypothetical protein